MEQRKTVDSKTEVKSMENKKDQSGIAGTWNSWRRSVQIDPEEIRKYDTHSWRRAGSGKDPGTQSA